MLKPQPLTKREQEIRSVLSRAYTMDEIGDQLCISPETVRKHISNIKIKRKLQLITELVADYWCEVFGTTLEEQREKIKDLSKQGGTLVIIGAFLFGFPIQDDKRTIRETRRNQRTEISARGRREYI